MGRAPSAAGTGFVQMGQATVAVMAVMAGPHGGGVRWAPSSIGVWPAAGCVAGRAAYLCGPMKKLETLMERGVFASRWLLAPLYLGLIAGQLFFSYSFFHELWVFGAGLPVFTEKQVITSILTLLDMIMVANLVIMVLIGGYATFVSKLNLDGHEDRPDWLDHIDPGTLKTKLAGALVSISGIHLLQTFNGLMNHDQAIDHGRIAWQVGIHLTFIITTILLAWSDLIFERKVKLAHDNETERKHG